MSALHPRNPVAQFRQLHLKSARKDRKPAPRLRIEILVVEMKRWRVAFPFPLITAPEPEEAVDPETHLRDGIAGEMRSDELEGFERTMLVPDRGALDRVQHVVRHQVVFVRLFARGR